MAKSQFRLVEVSWLDISSHHGWYEMEELDDLQPIPITSVGYYLGEENGVLRIAMGFGKDSYANRLKEVVVFPKGCVISVRPLRKGKGKLV